MKSFLSFLSIGILLTTSCNPTVKQKIFQKGELLNKYYELDNIKSVEIENLKGKHTLSNLELRNFKMDLDTYKYDGSYAKTKPGHFSCNIKFRDKSSMFFYSNSSSEIITSTGINADHTFVTTKQVNFENY